MDRRQELKSLLKHFGGCYKFKEPPVVNYHGKLFTIHRLYIGEVTRSVCVGTDRFSDLLVMLPGEFNGLLYDATLGILRDAANKDRNLF